MNISLIKNIFIKKFPESVGIGIFSGVVTAFTAAFALSLISLFVASIETGAGLFEYDFQASFFSIYTFIHALTFIFWMGVFFILTSYLIPRNEKRIRQSFLFFTNAASAFFSYIFLSLILLVVFYILAVIGSLFFR